MSKKLTLSILPRLSKGTCKPGGDVQEIADWLGRLGLVQYAQRFAENEIDVSVLPHLTKPAKPPPMAGRKQEVRQLRE
jgi:hypothetical protein